MIAGFLTSIFVLGIVISLVAVAMIVWLMVVWQNIDRYDYTEPPPRPWQDEDPRSNPGSSTAEQKEGGGKFLL